MNIKKKNKKRIKINPVVWISFFGVILFSCKDNGNDYASDAYTVAMATVQKEPGTVYPYFVLDNGETMWVTVPKVPFDGLLPGERVIGSFTVLQSDRDNFDFFIRLNDYAKVLTKPVINLTETNQDSIGNDKIQLSDMWVGSRYLNVLFNSSPAGERNHRVNLVINRLVAPIEDGYVHLEFRYNNLGEEHDNSVAALVSFDLGQYASGNNDYEGLKVKVNTETEEEKLVILDYSENTNGNIKRLTLADIEAARNME